jgi:glutamine cyclotransferase
MESTRLACARGLVLLLLMGVVQLSACAQLRGPKTEVWTYRILQTYPHDEGAFTQGLLFHQGKLYEGTGGYGQSTIRRVDWKTGQVEKVVPIHPRFFGEGITIFDSRLYQLTWQNRVALVYDVESFELIETLDYSGEGWGLTHDQQYLIMSDGTSLLRFVDPKTWKVVRKIAVHAGKQKIGALNELEYVEGEIWANIWHEDRIVRISPSDGEVLGWIDLSGLYRRLPQDHERVLNGIAYQPENKRLLVTGKNWPQMFEIEIVPQRGAK